jgi:predicted PurR-regulated permease PerM
MISVYTRQGRAAVLIALLGLALIIALMPFISGILSAPVFYVVFSPMYSRLLRWMRPSLSAGLTVLAAILLIVVPGGWLVALIAGQAQDALTALMRGPFLDRLQTLSLAGHAVGPQLVSYGQTMLADVGRGAFAAVGTVTLMGFNLAIAFFILFFMLVTGGNSWLSVRPYIPFSAASAELLRDRFRDVTISTVIGTGLTATIQGILLSLAFIATGLPNAAFWGVVTVVFAILPVVGSGMVWIPGGVALLVEGSVVSGLALLAFGAVVIGNVDTVIRPIVFRRWAKTHPLITILGAFAGVRYLGLIGILIGPLALSYFFELVRMYNEEYVNLSGDDPPVRPLA